MRFSRKSSGVTFDSVRHPFPPARFCGRLFILIAVLEIAALVLGLVAGWLALTHFFHERMVSYSLRLARRALRLRRKSVVVDGMRIVYLEGGHGEPLILLHGIGADKDNFLLVAHFLRRRFRLLIPDLPGFGESDKPVDAGYAVPQQIARLRAFSQAVNVPRFHLGGNSMGGFIAGAYAAHYPKDVRSLWLLAPAGVKGAKPSELMNALADAASELPIFARSIDEMRKLIAFVNHRPLWMPRFVLATMAAQQRRNYSLNRKIVAQLVDGPGLDELMHSKLRVPALIVWGNRDRALDVSGAEVMSRILPKAKIVIMPDVGHVPMIESPRQTANDLLAFHRSLPRT